MKNTGKTFEEAIETVFRFMYYNYKNANIQHDVLLKGPDGNRQFDVVITISVPDGEMITVIEGKDYKNKVSVERIDGFHSKMRDVNANKGVMISKMGFSSKAIAKAKRLGITLYALNDHSEFKEFDLQIPILIEEISPKSLRLRYTVAKDKITSDHNNMYFDGKKIIINNSNISEILNQSWNDGSLEFNLLQGKQQIVIPQIKAPYFLKFFNHPTLNTMGELEIGEPKLEMEISYKYYLCDIRDVMHNKILKDIDKENLTFFVDTNSLSDALPNLKQVSKTYATDFTGIQYVIKVRNKVDIEFYGISPKL